MPLVPLEVIATPPADATAYAVELVELALIVMLPAIVSVKVPVTVSVKLPLAVKLILPVEVWLILPAAVIATPPADATAYALEFVELALIV